MVLVCPCCGARASLEAWANDGHIKQFLAELIRLQGQVQALAPYYLGLFRHNEHCLIWPRAAKLIVSLREAIEEGAIRWDRGELRPAPPQVWAQAMELVRA